MMYKRLFQPLMLFLVVTMFAACSKKDATDGTNAPPPTGTTGKSVNIQGFAFAPGTLTVAKGTIVTFTNSDNASHTATADDGAFDTGTIAAGGNAKITFNTAGTFAYHCTFHGGMTGTIVVNP
ncbi:MAG: cupredoxin domain-containing protein [Ginsengibacter sp.]